MSINRAQISEKHALIYNGAKIYLPETSSRRSHMDYEEITVDKMEKTELVPEDALIVVAENFDRVGQIAFGTCTRLNPMQSICYEAAYKSGQNLLVAAPTGSGKTNVALMTVLNTLKELFKPGTTELVSGNTSEHFKIIYIAPMKSLATEQTQNFNTKLRKLGIKTSELTGDMQMTEQEIAKTHIIVTTPEKWDVVTRKSKGDVDLLSLVRLLIIDEVHLLQSDRGHVLEALVARTLRYVESSQKMTRIVGLSATLPNYLDVATFLRVNPNDGLFYFDNRFRPVPLTQTFIGVRALDSKNQAKSMDKICYNYALQYVTQSKQVMIFVHTRNSTKQTANRLREMIQINNKMELFQPDFEQHPEAVKLMSSAKDKILSDIFAIGFGIHHAGMVRHDRLLVEELFRIGALKVLVCTATLAWGVNFPAHAVMIRGTEIYDSSAGKFVDVGLLDVMQIFGRAGRPQYDNDGHAIIISALNKMDQYLKLLTNQTPIESTFLKHLTDNLNAEIVSGTVSSVNEAIDWMSYTYLDVRLGQNPLVYGCDSLDLEYDPSLMSVRRRFIVNASKQLDEARMIRFNEDTGDLEATDLGRIASHFYINYETIAQFNVLFHNQMESHDILGLIGESQEFQQIKFREEEANELEKLKRACYLPIAGGSIDTTRGKVSCLLQVYISRSIVQAHSLISDLLYIAQNATRIARGLLEYSLRRGWPITSLNLVKICKMLELRSWDSHTPFRQFELPLDVLARLEGSKCAVAELETMSISEIAKILHYPDKMGTTVKDFLKQLPYVVAETQVKPIKSNLLRLEIDCQPYFVWNDKYHGRSRQIFWVWVVDYEISNQILHSEQIKFSKMQVQQKQSQIINVNIPLVDSTLDDGALGQTLPNEYVVFILSDQWNGCDYEFPVDCRRVTVPIEPVTYTKVPTNLNQLALRVLQSEDYIHMFRSFEVLEYLTMSRKSTPPNGLLHWDNFNLIQSQIFFNLYHTDKNMLICGPAGSGKTIISDVAIMRYLNFKSTKKNRHKFIYLTPLESLAKLRYHDWAQRFEISLEKRVTLLDKQNLTNANVINETDLLVSSAANFLAWLDLESSIESLPSIRLIILDNMHLIGESRGTMMELVISKLNYFKKVDSQIRMRYIGISNTVANSRDLADWLEVKNYASYNFNPTSARPVQLETHVTCFSERHYSPRMSSMTRPMLKVISTYSPADPVIIYVSSKKQCNITAQDLISYNMQIYNSRKWLRMPQAELDAVISRVHDENVKLALEFGIGILYPSLNNYDKEVVEELFQYNLIQILICTTNYAWESKFRARLVIVKGTEHFDYENGRYEDYQPSDVMQMVGKAGRPGSDHKGIAVLMIKDTHKEFYKKLLYEPFPVESCLLQLDDVKMKSFLATQVQPKPEQLPEHISSANTAEGVDESTDKKSVAVVDKKKRSKVTISRAHEMELLSHTFLSKRMSKNSSYYGLNDGKSWSEYLNKYLAGKKFFKVQPQK